MPTTPPTIDPAPGVPKRGIKATFGNMVDAFNTWLADSVDQFAALALNVFNNAKEAFDSAVAAAEWAGQASDSAAAASVSASGAADSVLAAAAINGATMWTAGTTYQQYQAAISKVTFRTYRKTTTAAASTGGAVDPVNDPANWQVVGLTMPRSSRTSNTMLVARDMGVYVEITGGSFTQAFDTPANLGMSWYCHVENSGTGDITIPSSDGRTNWIMYPGEVRLFQCDGVTLRSTVIRAFKKDFTASATWVKPPGYSVIGGQAWHAGESGGPGQEFTAGSGGRGGRCVPFSLDATKLTNTVAVQVAASTPNPQTQAASSSFGSYVTTNTTAFSEDGGKAGAFDVRVGGDASFAGAGGGTGQDSSFAAATGGISRNGGSGGAGGALNAAGSPGVAPGGGGGGGGRTATGTVPGGAGARGEVRVWGIA